MPWIFVGQSRQNPAKFAQRHSKTYVALRTQATRPRGPMGPKMKEKLKSLLNFPTSEGNPWPIERQAKKGENNEKQETIRQASAYLFGQMNEIVMQSCGGDGNQHRHRHRNRNGADVFLDGIELGIQFNNYILLGIFLDPSCPICERYSGDKVQLQKTPQIYQLRDILCPPCP